MSLIEAKRDIFSILKKNYNDDLCDEMIISKNTFTSVEVTYLFVILNMKYGLEYKELCDLLFKGLTINILAKYMSDQLCTNH